MLEFLNQIFPLAIVTSIPIMITSIGGLYSERSGVVNIGLEGLMLIGAFVSSITIHFYDIANNTSEYVVWLSILFGALSGGVFALLHAYASITLKANQVISGTAINMLATALTIFFARFLTESQNISLINRVDRYRSLGILSKIPIIGTWFLSNFYLTTFFVLIIVFISRYIIFNTAYGLRLRACGEHPQAASSAGINVGRLRYQAVIMSGILSGIGGAIYVLTIPGEFNGTVNGLGFLALAALIFGKWKPINVVIATFFFGFMSTFASLSKVNALLISIRIPNQFYSALPFIATLIALIIFSKNAAAPKALGEPYDAGKR